jgi:hypothetical protein
LDDKIADKVKEFAKAEGSILDKVLGKVVSRKLLVFATATLGHDRYCIYWRTICY